MSGLISVSKFKLLNNSLITMVSRILGFIRDLLFARYLGASEVSDAFLIAFRLPNIFRRLLAEGVFMQAMIPAVISAKDQMAFKRNLLGWLLIVLVVISLPFVLWPELAVKVYAPGLAASSTFDLVVAQVPWTFPYLFMISLCGFYTAILNLKGHLWVMSGLPILLNIGLIVGVVYAQTPLLIAKMVFVAGLVQLVLCLVVSMRFSQMVWPSWPEYTLEVSGLLKTTGSGFMAQLVLYLSSCFDLWMLSFLSAGFVSVIYFADRLMQMPLGIFSVTLANVYTPLFAKAHVHDQKGWLCQLVDQAIFKTFAIALPAMCGLYLLSEDIMHILYGVRTASSVDAVLHSSVALKGFSVALPAYMFVKVFTAVAFAKKEPGRVLNVASKSLAISVVVSLSLIQHMGFFAMVCAAIASAWYQCYGLYQALIRELVKIDVEKHLRAAVVASISMSVWIYMLKDIGHHGVISVPWLIVKIISSMIIYDQILQRFGHGLKDIFILNTEGDPS